MSDHKPKQKRQKNPDGGHLLDERQTEQDADQNPPAPSVLCVQSIPERQGGGRPQEEPGDVGIDQMGLAVKPRHEQQRARHDQSRRDSIPASQEAEADRDGQRKLDDRCHPP